MICALSSCCVRLLVQRFVVLACLVPLCAASSVLFGLRFVHVCGSGVCCWKLCELVPKERGALAARLQGAAAQCGGGVGAVQSGMRCCRRHFPVVLLLLLLLLQWLLRAFPTPRRLGRAMQLAPPLVLRVARALCSGRARYFGRTRRPGRACYFRSLRSHGRIWWPPSCAHARSTRLEAIVTKPVWPNG